MRRIGELSGYVGLGEEIYEKVYIVGIEVTVDVSGRETNVGYAAGAERGPVIRADGGL